jgi:glutamyl-tRNA synthetase
VTYDEQALKKLVAKRHTPAETAKILRTLLEDHLDGLMSWQPDDLEGVLRAYCDASDLGPKEVFMPVRVAVTGRAATPPLFETMAVLGKETCRRRLRGAIEVLRTMKS